MQRLNPTIILLIILVILAGGYFGWKYLSTENQLAGDNYLFENFDTEVINKIEINYQGESATLIKDNEWLVASQGNVLANQPVISEALVTLPTVKIKELASENPDKQAELMVSDNNKSIKLYQDDNLLYHYYSGKSGSVFNTSYFRWDGSNKVYLVSENLQFMFALDSLVDQTSTTTVDGVEVSQ